MNFNWKQTVNGVDTATHCWQTIKNSNAWTSLLTVQHNAAKQLTKLITFLNSKCYWPSDILIHQQNSDVPHSQLSISHHKVLSCEMVKKGKNLPVHWTKDAKPKDKTISPASRHRPSGPFYNNYPSISF